MIAIVDYGVGNLGSVRNMLRRAGLACVISGDPETIFSASKIILPGVGAFDRAMNQLRASGLIAILNEKVLVKQTPLLGICLGMQLLTHGSEEGLLPGLGYIPARAHRFPQQSGLKVPHMGWNRISKSQSNPLTKDLADDARFYFVHSYYVKVEHAAHSLLKCEYGVEFDAGIARGNVFGAQFHPEKSHKFGLALLTAFGAL